MSIHDDSWADFTHTPQESTVSAWELLESFQEFKGFISSLSRKEMIARGWLTTADDLSHLGSVFFDLPHSNQRTLFRKSVNADENKLAIWHARARVEAERFYLAEDRPGFTGVDREFLRKLATLSVDPLSVRQLPSILSEVGIMLVYVLSLPGMSADGAVFHLRTGNPVIAMSLRFPRLDYFWFTLLHELAHLVLHADELRNPVYFDVEATSEVDRIEKAANRLAKDSIVDRESWRNCAPKYDTSLGAVTSYASEQGVHPSLIAGLLRKESGNYKRYSSIVNKVNVREIIFYS